MSDLDEHRYDAFQDANSMLFVSKDVARTLLAFVYCNQKKFDKDCRFWKKSSKEVIITWNIHKRQNIITMRNAFLAIIYRQEAEKRVILALITKM